MNYAEMIERAMKGRSVNSLAKAWGVQQRTLDRYVKGQSMPDYATGLKIAREAGINTAEAFEIFAAAEENHRVKNFKLQMGFARSGFVALIAAISMAVTLFLTTHPATAANMRLSEQPNAHAINYAKLLRTLGRTVVPILAGHQSRHAGVRAGVAKIHGSSTPRCRS